MKASVIIPTYNYARYISAAIESICKQEFDDAIEIMVIDDGSTDDTKAVLEAYIIEKKIRYHHQTNKGKAAATQLGIELATGEIIFNLDADDYFLPGKLQTTIDIFKQYREVVHVASPALITWQDHSIADVTEQLPMDILGHSINGTDLLKRSMENNMLFGGGSTFAARANVLKNRPWNTAIDMYTDEWLLIEVLLQGNSYFLPEPLSVWRVHGHNYSGLATGQNQRKQDRLRQSSLAILQAIHSGQYPDWLKKNYQLKHDTREIAWLEVDKKKSIVDAVNYLRKTILWGGHSMNALRKYHAFNRLFKW